MSEGDPTERNPTPPPEDTPPVGEESGTAPPAQGSDDPGAPGRGAEPPPPEAAAEPDPVPAGAREPAPDAGPEEAPPEPIQADAAGQPAEASKLEPDPDERSVPPARAREPEAGEPPPPGEVGPSSEQAGELDEAPAPRVRPEIPGADLEPDIVPEGAEALARAEAAADAELEGQGPPPAGPAADEDTDAEADQGPIAQATIDLGADARYRATGKRKTSVARVLLRPGGGEYTVNGKALPTYFPRPTLQRTIRQPLETVGYETRMDVVASVHGGGVSAQAGALRHGVARALLEADPNLRLELKRRGFLTRDPRVKERKKAGLKKARKRPQFSKR